MKKFKKEIAEYNKEVSDINAIILSEAEKAEKEVIDYAYKQREKDVKETKELNERPCSVCGKKEFVIKYRDVEGSVHGEVSGNFSLFGGSISGYVDGEIKTKPLLFCRSCGNERLIIVKKYESPSDVFENNCPAIFPTLNDYGQASEWLKSKGLEVARILSEKFYCLEDYKDIKDFSDRQLAKCGLVPKYKFPKKPSWIKYLLS